MTELQLDEQDKREIKMLLENEMLVLSESLKDAAVKLSVAEKLDNDTDMCLYEIRVYKQLKGLCFHLYDKDLTSYTLRDFWNNDTSVRDAVWDILEHRLNKRLFEKIKQYEEFVWEHIELGAWCRERDEAASSEPLDPDAMRSDTPVPEEQDRHINK